MVALPLNAVMFETHWDEWESAVKKLGDYRIQKEEEQKKDKDTWEAKLEQEVEDAHMKMDNCNRFAIFVQRASPHVYGALNEAKIADQFAHLLRVTMPPPTPQHTTMKFM